jgi:tyrosyl-tRNA synthetase
MTLKKDLARRIVTDFHSAAEATKAEEDWAKQFQKDELPENLDVVTLPLSEVASNDGNGVRVDRLLVRSGLAESNSEANRKIKEKAVRVDGEVSTALTLQLKPGSELTLRLGRKIKKILIAA